MRKFPLAVEVGSAVGKENLSNQHSGRFFKEWALNKFVRKKASVHGGEFLRYRGEDAAALAS
jgi:hypothetical protein